MSKDKAWQGRFEGKTAPIVERFTESISFDRRLYKQDIEGSIAHAEMLCRVGLLTAEELAAIDDGLQAICGEIEAGTFAFREEDEDIHMAIESALVTRIGDTGRKLHAARSRNDQVALDIRLWIRDEISNLDELALALQRALVRLAKRNPDLILPGCTHLQHAQPVLAAHYLLAYVEMLERDRSRLADCRRRVNVLPLGACALAGTSLPIDRQYVAERLGFESVAANSIDAVSDRDFVIELVSCLSIIAMHLSRLAEEWIIWCTEEFRFLVLDDSFCTGSSIMPQKKNPDVLELVRGRTGRVYGALVSLLTTMKGLPLAYNRDLQEDKEPLFDAVDTVRDCLEIFAALVDGVRFNESRIAETLDLGHLDATSLAEYLVAKGVPFRTAHHIVGRAVKECIAASTRLSDLSLSQLQEYAPEVDEDVCEVLGVERALASFRSAGSTAPGEVQRALKRWSDQLGVKD